MSPISELHHFCLGNFQRSPLISKINYLPKCITLSFEHQMLSKFLNINVIPLNISYPNDRTNIERVTLNSLLSTIPNTFRSFSK